jgi:ribulose-phosphate 3-epimerase
MVEKPWEHIEKLGGPGIHLVHIETIHSREEWELVKTAVAKHGATIGLAVNPETYLDKIYPYAQEISRLLIMTVKPGFDGQKYMPEMEKKMAAARSTFPALDIEIDGGVNLTTIPGARDAGVNLFAAASAIFGKPDWGVAVKELLAMARGKK